MNDYEFIESLGAAHPVEVSVTVAEAEQRERRGLPLPISGDPETGHAKELLQIRRERRIKLAAEAAAPGVETEAATSAGDLLVSGAGVSFSKGLNFCVGSQKGPAVITGALYAKCNSRAQEELERTGCILDGEPESFSRIDFRNDLLKEIAIESVAAEIDDLPGINELEQNSSPSVGAPNGAVCDNQKPTEGDLHQGGTSSKKAGHLL